MNGLQNVIDRLRAAVDVEAGLKWNRPADAKVVPNDRALKAYRTIDDFVALVREYLPDDLSPRP